MDCDRRGTLRQLEKLSGRLRAVPPLRHLEAAAGSPIGSSAGRPRDRGGRRHGGRICRACPVPGRMVQLVLSKVTTPEQRIERDFDEMCALLKESFTRHEETRRGHENWLREHEALWQESQRRQESFQQNHESWLLDMQHSIREQNAERAAA